MQQSFDTLLSHDLSLLTDSSDTEDSLLVIYKGVRAVAIFAIVTRYSQLRNVTSEREEGKRAS